MNKFRSVVCMAALGGFAIFNQAIQAQPQPPPNPTAVQQTGSVAAGQVPIWSATRLISGEADLSWAATSSSAGGLTIGTTAAGNTGRLNLVRSNFGMVSVIAGAGTVSYVLALPPAVPTGNNAILSMSTGGVIGFELVGQVVGTATNDNAAAGNVGELLSSNDVSCTTAGTVLASGTAVNVATLALTAGDWDVYGFSGILLSNTTVGGLFQANNTLSSQTIGPANAAKLSIPMTYTGDGTTILKTSTPYTRLSLSSNTTVYLVEQLTFSVSTAFGCGQIFARRAR